MSEHFTLSGTPWRPPDGWPADYVEPVPVEHVRQLKSMVQGWLHPGGWRDGRRPDSDVDTEAWNRAHPPAINWTGLASDPGEPPRPDLVGDKAGTLARVWFRWP